MKLNLSNITICAADCLQPNLALLALKKSMKECCFGEALLFSDLEISDPDISSNQIDKLCSKDSYSKFILKDLNQHIKTPFALIIQWDGYVIDPSSWDNSFTDYDYIGAKWPWHKDGMDVGNGGFSLRSKRLLDLMASTKYPFISGVNEDDQICRNYRNQLIAENSINIAPEVIADKFSYERSTPNQITFGFHGLFNLWRHTSDEDMVEIAKQLSSPTLKSLECFELLLQYFLMRKLIPLYAIYAQIKRVLTSHEISKRLVQMTNNPEFVKSMLLICEYHAPNLHLTTTPLN